MISAAIEITEEGLLHRQNIPDQSHFLAAQAVIRFHMNFPRNFVARTRGLESPRSILPQAVNLSSADTLGALHLRIAPGGEGVVCCERGKPWRMVRPGKGSTIGQHLYFTRAGHFSGCC